MVIDGMKNWMDILEILEHEKNRVRLIDGLFCNGCIDGFGMKGRGIFWRERLFFSIYVQSRKEQAEGKAWLLSADVDLGRRFKS